MMTMLTTMTMMGRARDDGDNAGGSDSQGQRRARTYVRTNGEGALADRLSRSRVTYVIPATYLIPYVRLSTSPNATLINPFTIHGELCFKVANSTVRYVRTYCKAT